LRSRPSEVARFVPPWVLLALALVVAPRAAVAADPPAEESPETLQARAQFVEGTDFVHKAQWADALSAFERSAKLKPHAVTTYNVGACERALGRYALARKTLQHALTENQTAGGTQLPDTVLQEIHAYVDQIDALLAAADVTLDPPSSTITVDGRPLEVGDAAATPPVLVAGIREPGPGESPPAAHFKMVLDPGVHVITLSRKGYADAVVNRTFLPAQTAVLPLALDRLPATLHITSNQERAVVAVNGADVGMAPVDVSRPGGSYRVVVTKPGFVTYEAQVNAQPGEDVDMKATLPEERHPITKQWWFWTAAGVVVAGAVVGTYFITRTPSTPAQPALNCGGLGWCVTAQ
jgi:hypothetical protein